ncbi:MAG TPA: hypothetical protein VK249_24645 [Anaerolineales bacterium]|nr:hypothetical protein [Anaerolineales bacterium]
MKFGYSFEEEVYLPLLDQRLTPEAVQEIFEAMELGSAEEK